MALLVRAPLTVQENSVEPQQPGAEITQTVAVLAHDLSLSLRYPSCPNDNGPRH